MVEPKRLSTFDRYLSLWVGLCMLVGIGIGWFFPAFPAALKRAEIAHVSIPVAILIWLMIYPMMVQIDFTRILEAGRRPKGICPAGFLGVSDDWEIPDPKGTGIEEFRSVRDFIRARVEELLRTMKEDR